MAKPEGSPFREPESVDLNPLMLVARSILVELKEMNRKQTLVPESYPLNWRIGDEQTAPTAATALATVKQIGGYRVEIYGYMIAAEESNTFELKWTDTQGARKIIVPTTSAGTIVVISEDIPLNKGNLSIGDVTIENVNTATAGLNYQACILYRAVK